MSFAIRPLVLLFLLLVLAPNEDLQAQGNRCATETILEAKIASDTTYARSIFAVEAALRDMASNSYRTTTEYTLPVVVHILHHGEAVGVENNLSDAQIQGAIEALNADFMGEYGGVDIDIEFELAVRDPEGNPTTGIVRVDAASAIPEYAEDGLVTDDNLHPSSENNLKALSYWPQEDYINLWIVSSLNGGMSPLGFAYLPPVSGFYDGVVLHRRVFGIGEEYDLLNNYDLNKSLTHELGHYLGLYHTFRLTNDCDPESNCSAQGDQVCDTPPTTGSAGCSAMNCPGTLVENYMDYAYDQCVSSFTEGQRTRMRNTLLGHRESLVDSQGLIPVVAMDAGVASIQGLAPIGCNATHDLDVSLQNFGTETLTEAAIHFSLDEGTALTVLWEGDLEAGASALVPIPALAAAEGYHSLKVWTSMDADQYAPNDTLTVDFEVVPGTWLTMELQFDFLPHGISWEIENTDFDMMVMEGGDYVNDVYASEYITIGGCAANGCYTLTVEDLFGNGMHYSPPGWYLLSDSDGNVMGEGSGNFGSVQAHEFCIEGSSVEPCEDINENGVCDEEEDVLYVAVPGCTDPQSCTYDPAANVDDESCEYLDALGDCGGECLGDDDGDGVCDSDEVPGCTDETACNFDSFATEENGACEFADDGYDCEGNPLVVVLGCLDPEGCNYASEANTDDGSCEYAEEGFDCEGNPLTSGLADLAGSTQLTPFPNPSNGESLHIQGLLGAGPHNMDIVDYKGRVVHSERILAEPRLGAWVARIHPILLPGAYVVRVIHGPTRSVQSARVLIH